MLAEQPGEARGFLWPVTRSLLRYDMPEITRFYGIVIKLFFGDHPPPHFHAVYGEYVGVFNINTLEMIEGDLPKRAKQLVVEWAALNRNELNEMWISQEFRKLPPLQ